MNMKIFFIISFRFLDYSFNRSLPQYPVRVLDMFGYPFALFGWGRVKEKYLNVKRKTLDENLFTSRFSSGF